MLTLSVKCGNDTHVSRRGFVKFPPGPSLYRELNILFLYFASTSSMVCVCLSIHEHVGCVACDVRNTSLYPASSELVVLGRESSA